MSDMFSGLFGNSSSMPKMPSQPKPPKVEKGVAWEAKEIEGTYYVPLRQVAELLESNDVLPKVRKGIEARVAAKAAEAGA